MSTVYAQINTGLATSPPRAKFEITELLDAQHQPSGVFAILVDGVLMEEADTNKTFITKDRDFIGWVCNAYNKGVINRCAPGRRTPRRVVPDSHATHGVEPLWRFPAAGRSGQRIRRETEGGLGRTAKSVY